jgi:Dullard-like phosphatase family protein
LRPGLKETLRTLSQDYEVIVFTASDRNYADAILDYIDKDRVLIHHRLYRQHCICYQEDVYIKNLRVLGRDLKHVVVVDNAPYAFSVQLDNGYPILPYFDDPEDGELAHVVDYLRLLKDAEDVRPINADKFKLKYLASLNIESYARYYQHMPESPMQARAGSPNPTFDVATTSQPDLQPHAELRKLQASLATYFKNDGEKS